MDINNEEGLQYLGKIEDKSINLVLTDPPYITSKKSGMDTQANIVKNYNITQKI